MSDDLVQRLRYEEGGCGALRMEAADRIEALEAARRAMTAAFNLAENAKQEWADSNDKLEAALQEIMQNEPTHFTNSYTIARRALEGKP